MRINDLAAVAVLVWTVAACKAASPTPLAIEKLHAGHVEEAAAVFEAELPRASQRDRALLLLESGLTQLDLGRPDEALARFSEAHDRMCVLAGEGASDALKTSRRESVKEFKGEPFEQQMCAFYEGWLHLTLARPELAAACFAAAQLYDRSERTSSDFTLAIVFEALTRALLDQRDAARALAARVASTSDDAAVRQLGALAASGDWNLIVLLERGRGPTKTGVGSRDATLAFDANWGTIAAVDVSIDGERTLSPRLGSTWHQAVEGGARVMDQINRGKAVKKDTLYASKNKSVADGTANLNDAMGSATQEQRREIGRQGTNAMIATGILYLILDSAEPGADVRGWRTLPESMHVALASIPEGTHELALTCSGRNGVALPSMGTRIPVHVNAGSIALVRVRLFENGATPRVARSIVARPEASVPVPTLATEGGSR